MKNAFKKLKTIKMTNDEKSRIRFSLVSLTKANNVYKINYRKSIKSPYQRFSFATSFRYIGTAVLILLVATTGVSFAAEGTLPGDLLYPVKVNVNEEVRSALTISNEGKMNWEKERVVLRVVETETLIKNNQLTPKRKEQAEAALKTQIETFANVATKTSVKDPNAVISATTELEPALKVHQKVIADIAEKSDKTNETESILSTVALGITNTSEQENVAINTSVENQPDSFAKLTDDKIDGAEKAIIASDNNVKIVTESDKKEQESKLAETPSLSLMSAVEEKTTTPPTASSTTTPSEKTTSSEKISEEKTSEVQKITQTQEPSVTATPTATSMTLKSSFLKTSESTLENQNPATSSKTLTENNPNEILTKAKLKLEQARKLRDAGKYREAFALAQEAYKDTVGLKIQAEIAIKNQQNQTKQEHSKNGEVKGVQEIKSEIPSNTATSTPTSLPVSNPTSNPTPGSSSNGTSSPQKTEVKN